jgi:hypothetical protein
LGFGVGFDTRGRTRAALVMRGEAALSARFLLGFRTRGLGFASAADLFRGFPSADWLGAAAREPDAGRFALRSFSRGPLAGFDVSSGRFGGSEPR